MFVLCCSDDIASGRGGGRDSGGGGGFGWTWNSVCAYINCKENVILGNDWNRHGIDKGLRDLESDLKHVFIYSYSVPP